MVGERVCGGGLSGSRDIALLTWSCQNPALDLLKPKLMMGEQRQIKYLISTGKSQWDATERYIDGL